MGFNPEDLILPGIGLGGELISAGLQGTQNRANRKYNDKMMWRQRVWALEDWNRQNEYNSPAAQMARLKAAGLNPNLVYGQGATAMSSQQPRAAQGGGPEGKAPRLDLSGPAMMYLTQQVQQKEMQLKDAQIATGWGDAALKNAQILATMQGVEGSKWDLGQRQRLADSVFEKLRADIESTRAGTTATTVGTGISIDRNLREELMNAKSIEEITERIENYKIGRAKTDEEIKQIKHQILNIEKDTQLKEADLRLREKGIYPGDPLWIRGILQALEKHGVGSLIIGGNPQDSSAVERIRARQGSK